MVDMSKVTPEFIADNVVGTLMGWFQGYTEPDDDIGGQIKVVWYQMMEPVPDKPYRYTGICGAQPMGLFGVDPSSEKRFRIVIQVMAQ